MMFWNRKKKVEPEKHYVDKTVQFSHAELVLRFDKITGTTKAISFTAKLVRGNVFPRCWTPIKNVIDSEFQDILTSKIPYDKGSEERKSFIMGINVLLDVFGKTYMHYDVDDMMRSKLYNFLKSFDNWSDGVNMVNIFMESTVEWLLLQEQKFESISDQEPELKLTEEEYEAILRSMQRLNTSKG